MAQGVGGVKSRPVLRPETEDLLHIVVAASLASQDMDRLGSVTGILSFSLLTRILTLVTDRALVGARSNLDPSQPGGDSGTAREGRGLGVLLQGSTEEIRGCFARLDLLSRFLTGFSVVRSMAGARVSLILIFFVPLSRLLSSSVSL